MTCADTFSVNLPPLLSVVIPVFNQEVWLEASLSSLAAQDLPRAEFLIVDDGSTDASPVIMERFVAADPRFRVLSRSNGGYGAAMNTGIDAALGDWIGILEPDDLCLPGMYRLLLGARDPGNGFLESSIGLPDVVKGGFVEIDSNGGILRTGNAMFQPSAPVSRASAEKELYVIHHSLWSAIYRRRFLETNGLRFPDFPGGFQDAVFAISLWLEDPVINWVDFPVYGYRRHRPGNSMGAGGGVEASLASLEGILNAVLASSAGQKTAALRGLGAAAAWHALRLERRYLPAYMEGAAAVFHLAADRLTEPWSAAEEAMKSDIRRYGIVRALKSGDIRRLRRALFGVRCLSIPAAAQQRLCRQ